MKIYILQRIEMIHSTDVSQPAFITRAVTPSFDEANSWRGASYGNSYQAWDVNSEYFLSKMFDTEKLWRAMTPEKRVVFLDEAELASELSKEKWEAISVPSRDRIEKALWGWLLGFEKGAS